MVFGTTVAQDLKKDIQQMNEHLNDLSHFQMEVVYSAGDTTDLLEEGSVSVYVSKEGLFYNMDESSIIINEKNTIIISDEEKSIIYSDNSTQKSKKGFDIQKQILKGLDTLIANVDSVYFADNNGLKTYYLRAKDHYFNLIELEFSGVYLTKITYYYNSKFVEDKEGLKAINKITINENPVFDKQLLETGTYFKSENGTLIPSEEFKNYILIYNESSEEIFD